MDLAFQNYLFFLLLVSTTSFEKHICVFYFFHFHYSKEICVYLFVVFGPLEMIVLNRNIIANKRLMTKLAVCFYTQKDVLCFQDYFCLFNRGYTNL